MRFLSVQSRSSLFVAAQRERRSGRGASVFLPAPGGGAIGPARVRAGLRGRGSARLCAGADGEGVAVRLRPGGDVVAAAGAADAGRPGVPLFGGGSDAGPLDAERISAASPAGDQRSVHAGAGGGARRRVWDGWGTWRSIRRGWRPTLRGTGWRARRPCGASGRSCDARCGAGSSSATRPIPTKRRARRSLRRRSKQRRRGWRRFPGGWRSCARRGP